jgi:RNA polymerase-binding transcription factor DksA
VTDVPRDPTTDIDEPAAGDAPAADLDRIAADFDGVDTALRRLDDGTYWTDEVTGASIPDDVLADDPVARRAGP